MSPRPTVREKARNAVCEALLDAVEDVAVESGIDKLTIAAVAERAGVAVGTLYNYFPDRDGMLTELFRRRRAAIIPRIAAAAKSSQALPFEDGLRTLVASIVDIFESEKRFLQIAVQADREGSLKPRDPSVMASVLEAFESVLRKGARSKLFPSSRVPAYARILHGALRSVVIWRLEDGKSFGADAELAVDTLLSGIAGRP